MEFDFIIVLGITIEMVCKIIGLCVRIQLNSIESLKHFTKVALIKLIYV